MTTFAVSIRFVVAAASLRRLRCGLGPAGVAERLREPAVAVAPRKATTAWPQTLDTRAATTANAAVPDKLNLREDPTAASHYKDDLPEGTILEKSGEDRTWSRWRHRPGLEGRFLVAS